jgi:hypothetical protein
MYKYREPHKTLIQWWRLRVCVYSSYLVNVILYFVTYRMEDKFEIMEEVVRQ